MTPTERQKLAYRAAHARIEVLVEALGREYCRLSPREQRAVTDLAGYIAGLMNVAKLHDGTIPRPRSPYAGHPWDDRIRDPDEHQQWCPSWKNCGGTTDGVCRCSDPTFVGKRRAAITALSNLVAAFVTVGEQPTDEELDAIDTMACRYHSQWCQYHFLTVRE